jgi:hypothetical protein
MIAKFALIVSITSSASCEHQVDFKQEKRLNSISVTLKEEYCNANMIISAGPVVTRFHKIRVIRVSVITNVTVTNACKRLNESSEPNIAVNHAMNFIATKKEEGESECQEFWI